MPKQFTSDEPGFQTTAGMLSSKVAANQPSRTRAARATAVALAFRTKKK